MSKNAGGNEGSSSNPPPTEESPRRGGRGRGEASPPHLNPHGRGAPPMHPWEAALFTPPRPSPPPVMGTPGRTAFGPYRPPAPSHGPGESSHPLGFHSAGAGVSGGGVAVAASGGIRIGGGSPAGRKRVRDGGAGGAAAAAGGGGGGNRPGEGGGNAAPVQHCSVCNKGFGSAKALFGHMRSHPDRGWKGVHPPPAFRAEEEFADLQMAAAEAEAAEQEAEEEAGEEYRVPDLNGPPPPEGN